MDIKPGFGAVVGLAVVGVVGYAVWQASQFDPAGAVARAMEEARRAMADALDTLGGAASTALASVNPASSENLVYRGVNAAASAAAGEPAYVSDVLMAVFNPGQREAERVALGTSTAPTVYDDEDASYGAAMRAALVNSPVTAGNAYGYGQGRAAGRW